MSDPTTTSAPRWRRLLRPLGFALAAGAVGATLLTFDWEALLQQLPTLSLALPLLGITLCTLLYWSLRAWRWRLLLGSSSPIPLLHLYLLTAVSLGLALVTPLGLGEAAKVELSRQIAPLTRSQGYSLLLLERALDLGLILIIALYTLTDEPLFSALHLPLLLLGAGGLLGGGLTLLFFKKQPERLRRLLGPLTLPPLSALLKMLPLTLAAWAMVCAAWWFALDAAHIALPPMQTASLSALVTLAGLLSLVPGSIGVAELSTSFLLQHWGVSAPQAQLGALTLRAMSLWMLVLSLLHIAPWRSQSTLSKPTPEPPDDHP